VIVCLHGFTIIFQTSINKCTDKKKNRTKIGCCLSFAYAETRLGELWRQSSRGELWRERRDCESSRTRLKNPWDLRKGKGEKGKEKGEGDGVSGRGDRVSLFFSLSIKLVNSVRFYRVDRVWSSLTIFEFLTRFYTLYVSWLVKSYDFTSQLVILITMVGGLDFSFYLKNNINLIINSH